MVIDWQSSGGFLYQTVIADPVSFWWIKGAKYTSKEFIDSSAQNSNWKLKTLIYLILTFTVKFISKSIKNFSYSCHIQQNERDHEIFVYSNSVTCKRPVCRVENSIILLTF